MVTVSMISWLSSSPNQNSDHAVEDSNLNTSRWSLFLLTFSCSRLTALFSYELQSRGASAWEKLMVVCTSHYLTSLAALRRCVEILRCSIRLYTSFHYASLSSYFCDQIRETISFGNIFELWYVYMEKIISVYLFFCCWQMLYWLFSVHIEGFYNFVSCTIFHHFFRYHFLKIPIIHNVYCLNGSSQHQSIKTSLYHHSFIVKDIWSAACTLYIVVKQTKADQIK